MTRKLSLAGLLSLSIVAMQAQVARPELFRGKIILPKTSSPLSPSKTTSTTNLISTLLNLINGSSSSTTAAATTSLAHLYPKAVDMKLLVLAADGNEPSFGAAKSFLDYLAIPYDAVVLKTQPMPALADALKGHYQGIILSTGNLSMFDGTNYVSALSPAGWTALDTYMKDYGVRLVSMYTFPEPRYGITYVSAVSTTPTAPASLNFTAAAATVFPDLNRANPLQVTYTYMYFATPTPATGETTTPVLTSNGMTVGAVHKKADGREYLALTMDHNPYLTHSLALNYGLFNWVTKGVFVGEHRIYMSPQGDDLFLDDLLFAKAPAACAPSSLVQDATSDATDVCPTARMVGSDVSNIRNWQKNWQARSQFSKFKISFPFNGYGITADGGAPANDSLKNSIALYRNEFFFLSHTYDHPNLDCYNPVPNSGVCTPANYQQSYDEISKNLSVVASLGLPIDRSSMVTPAITGLRNTAFLTAAQTLGVKYLVSDTSRPDWLPIKPNTGVRSPYVNSILYIPRRATNIFYNVKTPSLDVAGSAVDEYNWMFGPNGILRVGGTNQPFFATNQTYTDIIKTESDTLIAYMLRGEIYPTMYHQTNFINYSGGQTLFTDLLDSTFNKFAKISTLPVISLSQADIGKYMESRMQFLTAGVQATYNPGSGITVRATAGATAPITGICSTACENYGGQNISKVNVSAGGVLNIPLF